VSSPNILGVRVVGAGGAIPEGRCQLQPTGGSYPVKLKTVNNGPLGPSFAAVGDVAWDVWRGPVEIPPGTSLASTEPFPVLVLPVDGYAPPWAQTAKPEFSPNGDEWVLDRDLVLRNPANDNGGLGAIFVPSPGFRLRVTGPWQASPSVVVSVNCWHLDWDALQAQHRGETGELGGFAKANWTTSTAPPHTPIDINGGPGSVEMVYSETPREQVILDADLLGFHARVFVSGPFRVSVNTDTSGTLGADATAGRVVVSGGGGVR